MKLRNRRGGRNPVQKWPPEGQVSRCWPHNGQIDMASYGGPNNCGCGRTINNVLPFDQGKYPKQTFFIIF